MRKVASKTLDTHQFFDEDFGYRMEVLNMPVGYTFVKDNYLLSYGLSNDPSTL